ncbi:MAG: ATP-binding protein [Bacteroidales bacterium]
MMIKREKYLQRIRPFIDKPVIKVLTGIRRSGKSTLLKQLAEELLENQIKSSQIIRINKELMEFDSIQSYQDLYHFVSEKTSDQELSYYLFVDEVQEISQWEKAINSFLAEGKYDIYISGSNARLLSSDLASLLSGRYIEFPVYSFTYGEFKTIYNQKPSNEKSDDAFLDFLHFGGFPGLHHLDWNESVLRQYLESIVNTVVLKDIVMRNSIRDVNTLKHIIDFVASNCGNITSAKKISDFSKSQQRTVSSDTVMAYLEYAMNALLIHKTRRFDIPGKRLLETYEKYFMADIGLSSVLIGNAPETISGKLENIVYLELVSRAYQVTIGKIRDKEIDFIATQQNKKIYIQVTTSILGSDKTLEREYGVFDHLDNHFTKYVISLDRGKPTVNESGIRWMNIEDFLLKDSYL